MALILLNQHDAPPSAPCARAAMCSGRSNSSSGSNGAIGLSAAESLGSGTLGFGMSGSESNVVFAVLASDGIGATDWAGGTYTLRYNITNGAANCTLTEIYVCRLNSSCVSQESLGSVLSLSQSLNSTGTFTQNITGSSTTAAATDKVAFVLVGSNSNMNARTGEFTRDEVCDTPIDDAAPVSRRIFVIN